MEQAFAGYLHVYLSLKDAIMPWMPWIRIGRKLDSFLHITNCEINLREMNCADLEFIPHHNVYIPGKAKKGRLMVFVILTFCPP